MLDNVTPIRTARQSDYDPDLISPFIKAARAQNLLTQFMDEEAHRLGIEPDDHTEQTEAALTAAVLERVDQHPDSRIISTLLAASGFLGLAQEHIDRVIDGRDAERDQ